MSDRIMVEEAHWIEMCRELHALRLRVKKLEAGLNKILDKHSPNPDEAAPLKDIAREALEAM